MDKIDIKNLNFPNEYQHIFGEDYSGQSADQIIKNVIDYYESIISCMPGNVYWLDKNCKMVGCNQNVLDMLSLNSLDDFKGLTFKQMGKVGHWPKKSELSFLRDTREVLRTGKPKFNVEEPPIPAPDGTIIYFLTTRVPLFNKQHEVIGVLGVSINITERKEMEEKLYQAKKARLEKEKLYLEEKKKFSDQVAHDIRSPLAALDMLLQDVTQFPEEKRTLARKAINRIRGIANNLLEKNKFEQDFHEGITSCLLTSVIDSLVSEKRMQFRSQLNIKIEFLHTVDSYGLFSIIDTVEFKRVLSNLINNAVEAMTKQGKILITVEKKDNHAVIKIQDNGHGMPQQVINLLGKRGNTFGKKNGMGLGLAHAIETLQQWRGELNIKSQEKEGTEILITLPLAQPAPWFLDSLLVEPGCQILILDDDISIHQIWRDRFEKLNLIKQNIFYYHFVDQITLCAHLKKYPDKDFLLLCDYELVGDKKTGLDIIEELQLEKNSILVTSRYGQAEIQKRCENLSISILPKSLALLVPINVKVSK